MATKPADFFIGVVDFFAIILPGALLSYLALDAATQHVIGPITPALKDATQGWVAFALSSYLLGHFASLIGAFIHGYSSIPSLNRAYFPFSFLTVQLLVIETGPAAASEYGHFLRAVQAYHHD